MLGYYAETRFERDCLREVGGGVLRVEGSSWKLTSCKQIDKLMKKTLFHMELIGLKVIQDVNSIKATSMRIRTYGMLFWVIWREGGERR